MLSVRSYLGMSSQCWCSTSGTLNSIPSPSLSSVQREKVSGPRRESLCVGDFFGFRRTAHGPQTRLRAQTFGRLSVPRLRAERYAAGHAPTQCGQLGLGFRLSHPRLPRLWFRDRARLQRRAWQSKRRSAQAAPTPSPRTLRQPGAQRVALHIAQHAQAMLILGHRERLEAALAAPPFVGERMSPCPRAGFGKSARPVQ
jgi:hypothetical protein